LSSTIITRSSASGCAGGVAFAGIGRSASGSRKVNVAPQSHPGLLAPTLPPCGLDRELQTSADIDHRTLQLDAALGDPGHVQRVIQQACQMRGLSLHDADERPLALVLYEPRQRSAALAIGATGLRSSCASMAKTRLCGDRCLAEPPAGDAAR
jgi:hypothetical protein